MAGYRVAGAVDNDHLSIEAYKANHEDVTVWEADIRRLSAAKMLKQVGLKQGQLDLLAGCPPCQGFSTLRTLNGSAQISDPRNDLLSDFLRFVRVLRPRAVMMENVPRLADDYRFAEFCAALKRMGYRGQYKVLNAADYGVPQRRRRLIYLAGRGAAIPFARRSRNRKTVRDAIAHLPKAGKSGDPIHDLPERRSPKVMDIIRLVPKDGGSRSDLAKTLQLKCHKRCDGFWDVYGRLRWRAVAPTITSGCSNPSKGRFLHPMENRAITLREAALLQGFPPKYMFASASGKEALAAMIGNALPPPFVAAHSRSIRRTLPQIG